MFETEFKKIRRYSQTGLWGSVAVVILASFFLYVSPARFAQTEHTSRWMLIAGSVLAVLAVSMALLTIRKQIPRLRQAESIEEKVRGYASHIRSLYLTMLAVVVIICLFMVLSNQNVLLMLALISVLTLFLAYPNIYRIKVELGLTDEEMKQLFGDRYICENSEKQEEPSVDEAE
jgi:cobalamin synthase